MRALPAGACRWSPGTEENCARVSESVRVAGATPIRSGQAECGQAELPSPRFFVGPSHPDVPATTPEPTLTDLEQLFRLLVDTLAGDPVRLQRPIGVAELVEQIVPYRLARRQLGLGSSEDYDSLMLRFCAGEEGLARMAPDAARERLRAELQSPHPDLGVLRSDDTATITLDPAALARSRGPSREAAYAPPTPPAALMMAPTPVPPPPPFEPDPPPAPEELPLDEVIWPAETVEAHGVPGCAFCGGTLPADRVVHYCPHCGQNQTPLRCHHCESDLEPGWAYCVACGHGVGPR